MEDESIGQFASITGSSPEAAARYLGFADGNIEEAINLFYANGSADLRPETQTLQDPPSVPSPSTRPPPHRQGRQDANGIVHLDSEDEDQDISYDADVSITHQSQRRVPSVGRSASALRTPAISTPPGEFNAGAMHDDEAMARRLQEEFYGASGPRGARDEAVDEHGYRAPIARTTETLVGPGAFDASNADEMRAAVLEQVAARRQPRQPRERPGVFNQNAAGSIWNANADPRAHREQLARVTAGASEASSKSNILAEMYRPPFELMSRLSWDEAREQGRDAEKWILVNIQDPSVFDCQLLNRDIWKHPGIMETVRENFLFMQHSKDDPRGNQYVQYYFQNKDSESAYPHIAIVDPRTGEQVKVWSGPPAPKTMDFLMQLHEFLERYSLKATAKNPVARRKAEAKKETQVERMTEEEQMEMAMQASMAGNAEQRDLDPDDLTRSTRGLGESSERASLEREDIEQDLSDVSRESYIAKGSSETAQTSFASIASTKVHDEPPATMPNTTRIQFRHSNGRVVRRFALTDPVRRIYEWLKANPLEGKEGAEFELTSMQKNLIEALDDSIEKAGLKNATVMIEFISEGD